MRGKITAHLRTVEQRILDLDAHERRPAVHLRDPVHLRDLPRPHVARPEVAHLARLHEVVQRAHRLLQRRRGVERVHLQHVDVRRPQARERRVDLVEERHAREPALVHELAGAAEAWVEHREHARVGGDEEEGLGHDHEVLAGDRVLRNESRSATRRV